MKGGVAGDYGWKVEVLRQEERNTWLVQERGWTRPNGNVNTSVSIRSRRRSKRSGMLTAGE